MENVVIKPKKFLFIPSGTYNQLYLKPLRTNVTDYLVKSLYEKTHGGTNLTPTAMSGLAGSIISPSTKPAGNATIKNGWGTRRYRFVLVLDIIANKMNYVQVATGYTDYMGSINKNLDPNMQIYFNSFQTFTKKVTMTPQGMKVMLFPDDITQIVQKDKTTTPVGFNYDHMNPMLQHHLLRPQDVFNRLTMNMIGSGLQYGDNNLNVANTMFTDMLDARSSIVGAMATSNRKNGNSSKYVSSVLEGVKTAKEAYGDKGDCYIYSEAAVLDGVTDKPISNNHTIYKMGNLYPDFSNRGYLTLKELNTVIPELPYVTTMMGLTQVKKIRMPHQTGDSEELGGISQETQAATILANALPDIMLDSLLGQVNFIATNNYPDGKIRFTWTGDDGAKSIIKGIEAYINKFSYRLTNEILYDLCHQGGIRFNLHLFADITEDIKITISFDGRSSESFVMPIFCDSIYSPVIGGSGEDLETLSRDMESLAKNICGE